MRLKEVLLAAAWVSLSLFCLQCRTVAESPPWTLVTLTDASSGREIAQARLREGDECVLNWQNSLFNLPVEEVFAAERGRLVLRSVTFADPRGTPPPSSDPKTWKTFTTQEARSAPRVCRNPAPAWCSGWARLGSRSSGSERGCSTLKKRSASGGR